MSGQTNPDNYFKEKGGERREELVSLRYSSAAWVLFWINLVIVLILMSRGKWSSLPIAETLRRISVPSIGALF